MAKSGKFIGGISFGVSMSTAKLASDTKRARGLTSSFVGDVKKRLGSLRNSFNGVGTSIAAAFGAAALVNFAKRQFDMIDALHDTSKNLGITTEAMSRLNFAAEQNGASQEAVERALKRLPKSTRDAALGVETVARAYGKLGLDAKALNQLSPDQQFREVAEAIKALKNPQDQMTAAQDIFGRGAAELVETLRLGKGGLQGMADEADRLGATINSIDAAKVAKAADELNKIKKQFAGLGNQIAVDFGPQAVGFGQRVATGLSRMTGGEGGENVAERQLRQQTELKQATAARMTEEVKARMAARQTEKWKATIWTRAAASNARDKRQGAAFAGIRDNLAGRAGGFLSGLGTTAQQIAIGVMNSSEARNQRQSTLQDILSKSLFTGGKKATDATWAKTQQKTSPIADFNAEQSGSLASYQQRVRGAQQFSKVEEKQLAVQERIADGIDELVNIMPNWGIA